MAKQRAPRRTFKLVRYFESILDSTTASEKLKMQAAERLVELHICSEESKARREVQLARAEARAREAEQAPVPETASELLEQLKRMTEHTALSRRERAQARELLDEATGAQAKEIFSKVLGS